MNHEILNKLLVILRKVQNIQASAFGKVSVDIYSHYASFRLLIEVRVEDSCFSFSSDDCSTELDIEYQRLKNFFMNYE